MVNVFISRSGVTSQADAVDPAWLAPGSGVSVWVDLSDPSPVEAALLRDVFRFHELAVEDALSESHQPKAESYGDCLFEQLLGLGVVGTQIQQPDTPDDRDTS